MEKQRVRTPEPGAHPSEISSKSSPEFAVPDPSFPHHRKGEPLGEPRAVALSLSPSRECCSPWDPRRSPPPAACWSCSSQHQPFPNSPHGWHRLSHPSDIYSHQDLEISSTFGMIPPKNVPVPARSEVQLSSSARARGFRLEPIRLSSVYPNPTLAAAYG